MSANAEATEAHDLRIVYGAPTDEELAAVIAVLMRVASRAAAPQEAAADAQPKKKRAGHGARHVPVWKRVRPTR